MFTEIHFEVENAGENCNNETIPIDDHGLLRPQIQMVDDDILLNLTDLDQSPQ